MKKISFIFLVMLLSIIFSGCKKNSTNTNTAEANNNTNQVVSAVNASNTNGTNNTNTQNSNTNLNNSEQNENVNQVNNENINNDATAIDTSDWQTYANEEYGFSFKYPKEYIISVNDANTVSIIDPQSILKGKVIIEHSESFITMTEREILMIEPGKELMPLKNEKFLTINNISSYRSLRQLKKGELLYPPDEYADQTWTEIEYRYLNQNDLIRATFTINGENRESLYNIIDVIGQSFSL